MYYLRSILLAISCCLACTAFSQTDSNVVVVDSTLRNPDAKRNPIFNAPRDTSATLRTADQKQPGVFKDSARLALERMPKVAVRRSAILPGWGQVTNGRWWKVPLVYGGFIGLGLAVDFNQKLYRQFIRELQYRDANPTLKRDPELVDIRDQAGLRNYRDFYRRNRDLSVLAGVGLYAINIIDAYVDAKFFRFDISDKLGLKVQPSLMPPVSYAYMSPVPAIKIQIKL